METLECGPVKACVEAPSLGVLQRQPYLAFVSCSLLTQAAAYELPYSMRSLWWSHVDGATEASEVTGNCMGGLLMFPNCI